MNGWDEIYDLYAVCGNFQSEGCGWRGACSWSMPAAVGRKEKVRGRWPVIGCQMVAELVGIIRLPMRDQLR